MATVELGKGRGLMDVLNVSGITNCAYNCPFRGEGNGKFRCMSHNGHAEILVMKGMSRETVKEFEEENPACLAT